MLGGGRHNSRYESPFEHRSEIVPNGVKRHAPLGELVPEPSGERAISKGLSREWIYTQSPETRAENSEARAGRRSSPFWLRRRYHGLARISCRLTRISLKDCVLLRLHASRLATLVCREPEVEVVHPATSESENGNARIASESSFDMRLRNDIAACLQVPVSKFSAYVLTRSMRSPIIDV